MLKKDVSINNEIKITWASSLIMLDRSFTGKKPPDDISVNAKFSELNALIEKKFRMIKIASVKPEYNRKIFKACLNISELSKDI